MLPLQLIDSFLLNYNIGQALLLVFILTTVGALPLKSRRILGINTIVFGLIFLLTPQALAKSHYLFLGIALLIVGPILYTTGNR
ncbi:MULTISPECIES: hypothetical protein [Haloferax]|uniref:DUF8006 domain-containing protein n=2 Tax=Haloferax TaxID=2251 RepID=A0A6G1Z1F7_9EURY|nr:MULTISPECIES: hypothetical protein [Haloferax]KAB1187692.1 hypothetical protein Hfx1149_06455 [Haloferax sp. CBA1149]MRW80352.1 hypothetical protein [Haloferax marinisediminis]